MILLKIVAMALYVSIGWAVGCGLAVGTMAAIVLCAILWPPAFAFCALLGLAYAAGRAHARR